MGPGSKPGPGPGPATDDDADGAARGPLLREGSVGGGMSGLALMRKWDSAALQCFSHLTST